MAEVIITIKIMPDETGADLDFIRENVEKEIYDFGASVEKVDLEPVAFGLKALKIFILMDESKGDTEELEKRITEIRGVGSVQVIDVRRAVG